MEHHGHTQTVTYIRGLPGSGKTTWFREQLKTAGACTRYISRDDLRFMLLGNNRESPHWTPKREYAVIKARDALLRRFLDEGCCVFLDETFLSDKTLRHVRDIVLIPSDARNARGYPVVGMREVDFYTDVTADVCVERDRYRGDRAVGAGVIREAAKMLYAPRPTPQPGLPEAIICDLDGTLALFTGNPYDRPFGSDTGNEAVVRILTRMATSNVRIILTSGRKDEYRDVTVAWLKANDITYHSLLMRPPQDRDLKDSVLKRRWYEDVIRDYYNILFVLDDRDSVVDMWRRLGLTCLQVESGAF